jgi:hypothetical protein
MILTSTGITDNSGNVLVRDSGSVVNVTRLNYPAGDVGLSETSSGTMWTTSVTKIGGTETNLLVMARLTGHGPSSGVCGTYLQIGSVRSYQFTYIYDSWGQADYSFRGVDTFTGLAAGSQTVTVGWAPLDGTAQRPFIYFNASGGSGDGRRRAQGSNIVIFEIRA